MFFKKKVKDTYSTEPPEIGSRVQQYYPPSSAGANSLNHALISREIHTLLAEQRRLLLRKYKEENPLKLADLLPALVAAHMADPDCTVDFVLEKDAMRFQTVVSMVTYDNAGGITRIARQFADIQPEYY